LTESLIAYNWMPTGKLEPCEHSKVTNAKQKDVPKIMETKSETPEERVFLDISYAQCNTMGGSMFWLMMVDDATGMAWSRMLKRKSDTTEVVMSFLRRMKARGTPVKYICCDNSGENKDLMNKGSESQDLTDVEFEFTARDSPPYIGKVERKFAELWGRMRALFNAARIPQKMKDKV
jgi:hypothetical protein